jgi:RNA polymerase sigma-B factor
MSASTDAHPWIHSGRRRGVEERVEDLAVAAEGAEDAARRAELQDQMVLLSIPLADGIARRYTGRGIETDDLIQVARTGLVQAVRRYRPSRGCAFEAFAAPTISGEVKRWFRDHGWSVRPPRRLQELRQLMTTHEERLQLLLARRPTDVELAAAMGVDAGELVEVRLCTMSYRAVSLDAPTASERTLADHLLVETCATDAWDTYAVLGRALTRQTDRQRLILRLRFGQDWTQSRIADHIGVSQMQVSRLLRDILGQLRAELEDAEGGSCALAG